MKKDTYIFHFIISPNDVGLTIIIIKKPDDQGSIQLHYCCSRNLKICKTFFVCFLNLDNENKPI